MCFLVPRLRTLGKNLLLADGAPDLVGRVRRARHEARNENKGLWRAVTRRSRPDFRVTLRQPDLPRILARSPTLGDRLGTGHDPGQHAAYVKSWVQVHKEDPKEILRAARVADKISN